jgi:hypothetical protein
MDLEPLPALETECGVGCGLAVCPNLGLLVTSDDDVDTLSVWSLPGGASGGAPGGPGASAGASAGVAWVGGLTQVCTLGGAGSVAPFPFKFSDGGSSLAFAPPIRAGSSSSACPLLLVADFGADAVHLVDVVGRAHAGYLAPPGTVAGPRGVAASGTSPLVAVSAWKESSSGDPLVMVYRGIGAVWEVVRVIGGGFGGPGSHDGQLDTPHGLRFSREGSSICVTDSDNGRASVFRVGDGGFVRHMATGLNGPLDVEEVEGGWLVACADSHTVEFVVDGVGAADGGWASLGRAGGGHGTGHGEFWCPSALAAVPGLGLVVRDIHGLHVFATPDAIAMAAMSPTRVAWMAAVARAVLERQTAPPGSRGQAGRAKRPR